MYEVDNTPPTTYEKVSTFFAAIGAFIFSSIEAIVVALAISVVLYLFFMTPHEVVGTSMVPNFQNGEHLIANKIIYKYSVPKRGDVVIFKYSDTQDFIKRVIGLPGDSISIKDGRYYINGKLLDEGEYLDSVVYTSGGDFLHEGETETIPEGTYFVSGDNRPHSSDSREFGPVAVESIKGKAWLVYYPFSEFRVVKHANY
ncbi:MAG: Signal peptidase I [candidate division WS6 bacterium GW2011_GWF2_39_15]|uniref:Signal peptidase I n=1 Tax=candidate division WS6 bacterium GW2011_GWF2_39_15 TaxID=1619100 RepID=A0A0G0QWM5_9BACT|nr:MAG: Signal peptidase I [candidate division WS6 bacterium GW2011_GWF2_39_15]